MSRRWARVAFVDSLFLFAIRGRRDVAITSDWPDDATIVNGSWEADKGLFTLTIESAQFDEVPAGNVIPDWQPTFTAHSVEPAALAVMEMMDRVAELTPLDREA